jgi:hypothetical protein
MAAKQTEITEQTAVAAREFCEAADANGEQFTDAQAITLLEDEIRILRERGFTDECITDLFTGFDIELKAAHLGQRWPVPGDNLLLRLIWDKIQANQIHPE